MAVMFLVAAGCGGPAPKKVLAPPPATTTTIPAPTTTTIAPCPAIPTPPATPTMIATATLPRQATYSATPGGPPKGLLQAANWGGPAARPVRSVQPDWLEVPLDRRPNAATGWIRQSDVTMDSTPYRIVISICQRSLTLYYHDAILHTSKVGVGQPQWATPLGPTFVDAIVATPRRQLGIYGPTVLILGLHSNVFTEFDGGDGTVAIHGYPSDPGSTDGVASSHGCVRANPQTIADLRGVPVGTPVDIYA